MGNLYCFLLTVVLKGFSCKCLYRAIVKQDFQSQGINIWKTFFFLVREKLGNNLIGQGMKSEKLGNLKIGGIASLQEIYILCSRGKGVVFCEIVYAHLLIYLGLLLKEIICSLWGANSILQK